MKPAGLFARVAAMAAWPIIAAIAGCAGAPGMEPIERPSPPPSYQNVAERHNKRAERLSRIWARAVVEIEYLDENDRRRHEQGEGHLQIRRPGGMAIDVGKLGETYIWLGADEQRYWFFDLQDERELLVGRHKNIGRACNEPLGLPAHPLDIVELLGVTPWSASEHAGSAHESQGSTSWSDDGRWIVVDRPLRRGRQRLLLDPETLRPSRIELYPRSDREQPEAVAELEKYDRVELRGVGGYFPEMASRVTIRHPASETEITLHLSAMSDGASRNRLTDEVFDLPSLMEAFAPRRVNVLDRDCADPALPATEMAEASRLGG